MSLARLSREDEDGAEQRQAAFTGEKYNVYFTTCSVFSVNVTSLTCFGISYFTF